jgi:hypothetical protein
LLYHLRKAVISEQLRFLRRQPEILAAAANAVLVLLLPVLPAIALWAGLGVEKYRTMVNPPSVAWLVFVNLVQLVH